MKKSTPWAVTSKDSAPAGLPDECFWCKEKIGKEHKPECVVRQRTVVIKIEWELVYKVPESWTEEDINFHLNESSWCSNNLARQIAKMEEDQDVDFCVFGGMDYVREATKGDEKNSKIFVEKD